MAKGVRIIALATELGVKSEDVLAKLRAEGLGDKATSAQSTLTVGLAETVREWFRHGHSQMAAAVETAAPVPAEVPQIEPRMVMSPRIQGPRVVRSEEEDPDAVEAASWRRLRGGRANKPPIYSMTIGGFKSIGSPITIPLRPITLLYGPNSAGKSSIIQAIHYAAEFLSTGLHDVHDTRSGGSSVDLGGFRNVVHGQDPAGVITLGFDVPANDDLGNDLVGAGETPMCTAGYRVNLTIDSSGLVEYSLALNDRPFAVWRREVTEDPHFVWGRLNVNTWHPCFSTSSNRRPQRGEWLRGLGEWCKAFGEPDPQRKGWRLMLLSFRVASVPARASRNAGDEGTALSQLLQGPLTNLARLLGRSHYVGPLRSVPPRDWDSIGDHPEPATGLAAWRHLARTSDRDMLDRVNCWLQGGDHFDTGYRIERRGYRRVYTANTSTVQQPPDDAPLETEVVLVDGRHGDIAVGVADVGKGIAQVVPVIVEALCHPEEHYLLMLEQPELHLHPRGQAVIGDLLIKFRGDPRRFSSGGAGTSIALVETHSEYLILRILRRIRETTEERLPAGTSPIQPDDVAVVYVEPTDAGSEVKLLRIDTTGEFIDRWPRGFFAERAEELF